ncbi:class I adenylate-forming enzyme family protein [Sphingomonas canadensis]|uniref:Class I adenylate-forming enzyme family protein n=1 Tax=Sphingomonas canadensis TaxID=1219257 RepID=A0ABW3H744_9SPHN|nr:class I adenylate-forming enzyme family protein [Sphingomonas canadensis]MCW3836762.1 acyl--CoA ligase [Sphingomonas canadensis]
MNAGEMLTGPFSTLADLIRAHARERGDRLALVCGGETLDYAGLDRAMDRVAAALQRDGIAPGTAVAILAVPSIAYMLAFLGALRAGCVPAPLSPSATPAQLGAMIADCGAPILFHDDANAAIDTAARRIALDGPAFGAWLAPGGTVPAPVAAGPDDPFNIIYSSGTTGTPKGIVQSHGMRWQHIMRAGAGAGFTDAVAMIATPLYSNTTLVLLLPVLGWGGTAVLMRKFEAGEYLRLAEAHRATHTMLVPVQYERVLAHPGFDAADLSSFRLKFCTSAPFSAEMKADALRRWPGALVEYYGMTEGGGTTILVAHLNPDKLHTVGKPVEGHDIRLIDEQGREVPQGEVGEVVGRSPAMMTGYHGRESATREAEWFDAEGRRFIRHGDLGRFDAEGFLTLVGRKKDVIISGGFNVYPADLEAVLAGHPDVADCTVVGVPSPQWGETPVGFYVPRDGAAADPATILEWTNDRLGRTQRLSALAPVDALPRSSIGKVLKRELRDRWEQAQ